MLHPRAANYSRRALYYFESAGLIVIAVATIYAGYQETMLMISNDRVTLADLLLMFLYLEILTMVGLYFESGKLPVRFPLYIAMVAMARYVIVDIKEMDNTRLLGVSASIVLVAVAVLVIRYGHVRYPYLEDLEDLEAASKDGKLRDSDH
ncbi:MULTISPECIES: phosphate-starvation-inducible protein PsiE [unclassified Nitrosospira]|uniref:phosphate-starvation-inducible protein PsiE n=1 Tax=unclassified Nitrosospira TaxID=2609267 RepID=UPI000D315298|nr:MULTISPECIES: phosphate-starvation-inducible PsiE family protein [unclassified Nitrosospira]PTR15801.1 protein PsiE [Nitrosospira sp. Nsp2]WON74788.1 phosphate-starvation-inducible PsiE family protein [Nitrosospira sp. Is2]